jgi:hypothetical protein
MKTTPRLVLLLLVTLLHPVNGWAQPSDVVSAEEEPEVIGIERPRAGGGFLGLNIEGNALVVRFYDEEKKEIPADAARGTARWNNPQKAGQQRTVLASSGSLLRSPPTVRPPHVFVVYLSLFTAEGEVIESHAFNTRELKKN